MYTFNFIILILIFYLNSIDSNKDCDKLNKIVKKQCRYYSGNSEKNCVQKRFKRSDCTDLENTINYKESCLNDCLQDKSNFNYNTMKNISTRINVTNVINNHNKIQKPIIVNSLIRNNINFEKIPKEEMICCKVLIPICDVNTKKCDLKNMKIQDKCGKICEEGNYRFLGRIYNYYLRKCVSPWIYEYCNYCKEQNDYFGYSACYQHYKWCQNVYNWYIKNYNGFYDKDGNEVTTKSSFDEELTTTEESIEGNEIKE